MSAYRAGTDLVYVIAPERAADVAANFSPVLMTTPLPGPSLTERHESTVLDILREVKATAAIIGPGLWREKETLRAITRLISRIRIPMVIDADAIRAIGALTRKPRLHDCVYTPHAEEFKELTGATVTPDLKDRTVTVPREAAKLGAVILLKGHVDVISDGATTFWNRTGSPFMTKGGLGDTLTGICGAYLARGADPLTAACAAAYVNGKAGSLASTRLGESLLPTDLIERVQDVIRPSTKPK
jgi:ADP-dependent NAD(P)H-hydrate dehydratase / NAD(P)H-hydrate epimerase